MFTMGSKIRDISPKELFEEQSANDYWDEGGKNIGKWFGKLSERWGVKDKDVTEEDIYSGAYDEDIQNAVEDLIIDEAGLELAFEGSRFSDLCRVALRRNASSFFFVALLFRPAKLQHFPETSK